MKKLIAIVLFTFVLVLSLSACGEKASPIELPPTDEISSIEISNDTEVTICTEEEIISTFVQKVEEATPTSRESVNDVPNVPEYTRVDFILSETESRIYIYQEDSKWYVEQPYVGIYETDETLLEILAE